jgi:hypothetical protein
MRSPGFAGLSVVVLAFVMILPGTAAGQGVGAIGGSVTDSSGAALPGVAVSLSNPGVIGGTREGVTDARGAYEFPRLVPGTYTVRASLTGFRTAVQERVVVNSDVTARVDLKLEIGALEESILVSGQAPLLDTTQTLKQTVLTRENLDLLPSRSDIWAIGRTVPAVVMNKYDVGGSEMFSQSFASVYGSTSAERTYAIDGMDVSWAGSEGFVISYLDAHMFEEVNFQTASGAAESAKGGPVTNMITKTGTNRFAGQYAFTGGGKATASDNLSPSLRADLLAAVPPRALAANPNLSPSGKTLGIYDHSLTYSGPLVPNRLWFTATSTYVTLEQYRIGSYNIDGTRALDKNRMRNGSGKVSWQVRPNHQLHALYNFNNKGQFNRTENTGPLTDFIDNDATSFQIINSSIAQTKWTSILRGQTLVDVSASMMHGDENGRPQPNIQLGTLPSFDSQLREHRGAVPAYLHRQSTRVNVLSSVSLRAGSHDLKAGYQLMWRKAGDTFTSFISPYAPVGFRAVFRNGVPDSANTYNSPTSFWTYSRDHAGYIQDRWTPTRKLTLNLGLRLETTYGWMPALCQQETIFIAGQCFAAIEGVPNLVKPSPRFGLIYDVGGDGRTAVKVTVNRYNQPIGVNNLAAINPVRLTNDTRRWIDANNDRIPQLTELGASTGFNLGTTTRFSDDLEWPYSAEYSIGLQRQLPWDVVAGVTYIHRRRGDEIGTRNLAVPTDSYIPLPVVEAVSGRQVTVYNQNPALRGRFDNLRDNAPQLDAEFNGVDLTFNKRMGSRWMVMGGMSFGESLGDIYGGADLNNPNSMFRRGVVGDDVPFSFKAFAVYQLPHAISVSANLQHFTGFPELTTVLVSSNTVSLTQVSQSITVAPRGGTRLPDVNMVDVSVRRTFRPGGRYSFEPVFDVFNLTNGSAIRARTTQLGPTYGRASDIQRARLIKLGVNVKF